MLAALDMHAHIKPDIDASELHALGACVVAMTRSLDEYAEVRRRNDHSVIWGVGCHPGLAKAIHGFSEDTFQAAISSVAMVGEVGLDGGARVPMDAQRKVFDTVIGSLTDVPRIASIHSYRATGEVLDTIEHHHAKGAVLHWWLGSEEQTRRAVDLGAYFSVNASQIGRWAPLKSVPSDRLLTETDHPFGDRREAAPRRPGGISVVERRLGDSLGLGPDGVRRLVWRNFSRLAADTGVQEMLPRRFQVQMLSS